MTDSDQPRATKSPLCRVVRGIPTLWGAWISIRSKAIQSPNRKTAQDARRIDQNPQGTLRRIQEELRSGVFEFAPQKGVLKRRDGKKPRPLVISPVVNRIVQRAILDTIQSKKPSIKNRLGSISIVLDTPTSVGGIPGKGSGDAVRLIRKAIECGASHFIRSDIRDFFTRVQTRKLIETIREITGDGEFADLIRRGLSVELENADDPIVSEWRSLFPDGTTGVPQGSSLSAFCANFVLRDFDTALNQNGTVMVRYIDDFVILGPSDTSVQAAWSLAISILDGLKLEFHEPVPRGDKASLGAIGDGFEFLSYRFRGRQVGLSRKAKSSLIANVDMVISSGKRSIGKSLSQPRRAETRFAQVLVDIDRRVRGWGDSFREVDQRLEFKQLDDKISERIKGFVGWYSQHTKSRPPEEKMRALGVALLHDTPRVTRPEIAESKP